MQHGLIISLTLTNTALVGLIAIFVIYNFLLIQLAPFIKKGFEKLFKTDYNIGFNLKGKFIGFRSKNG